MAEELLWNALAPEAGAPFSEAYASDAANWSPGRPPMEGDTLVFSGDDRNGRSKWDLPEMDLEAMVFNRWMSIRGSFDEPISAGSWTFNHDWSSSILPPCDLEAQDTAITAATPLTTATFHGGVNFGNEDRTLTISGQGVVELHRINGTAGKGQIVKNGPGTLLISGWVENASPPILVNEGRLQVGMTKWVSTHLTTIGPAGTMSGIGTCGSVVCRGKIAPSPPNLYEPYVSPALIQFMGSVLAPAGAGATVELDLLSNGTNEKLMPMGTADFSGADLKLVFASGYQLAMGGTATLVEVPVGGQAVRPFRNAVEGWKVVGGGAVYELSYTGGASGKSVVMTRVPPPVPELAMLHQPERSRMLLTLSSLPGMRVVLQSSTDLVTWRNDPSYTPYYNIPATGTISTARPMDAAGRMFYRVYGVVP